MKHRAQAAVVRSEGREGDRNPVMKGSVDSADMNANGEL